MLVALEHHVLKQVSESAAPLGIILGADVIPHLHRYRRAFVILDRVNLEAVFQCRMFDYERRNADGRCAGCRLARFKSGKEATGNKRQGQESRTIAHESPNVTVQWGESTRIWQEFQIADFRFQIRETGARRRSISDRKFRLA